MTTDRSYRTSRRLAVVVTGAALLLSACGYDATELPKPEAVAPSSSAPAAAPVQCDNATQSYSPSADGGPAVAKIRERGRLIAGVSADSLRLGSNNPLTNQIEGFDIDVAAAIAKALDVSLQLRVISAADRIPLLKSGDIDIVTRNMTMNCARWQEIAFSAVYYSAAQKVLVGRDEAAQYTGPAALSKKRVCAPAGSTSIDNIVARQPDVVAVAAPNHSGCLIRFQRGEVDAITGDDTVLAGLAAQDPYAVVPAQDKITDEPYGVGVNKDNVDLVRFINTVLDERRRNGDWQASYDRWFAPALGPSGGPPAPRYGR